ncbi:MAG: Crp/Fnr family transcriptional regulator [Synechococcus sp.]
MVANTFNNQAQLMREQRAAHESPRKYTLHRHQTVALKEGYLWRLEEGYLRTITMSENGDIKTLGIWGPDDIVGIPLNRSYPFQIESLTAAKVALIQDSSMFDGQWLVSYLKATESLLNIQHQSLVRDRLVLFLQWLGNRFGQQGPHGQIIKLRLTHQEISEAINTTRVTVTRVINELGDEGFLAWSQGHCVLINSQ